MGRLTTTYIASEDRVRFIVTIEVGDPIEYWKVFVNAKHDHGQGQTGGDYPHFVERITGTNNTTFYRPRSTLYFADDYAAELILPGIDYTVDFDTFTIPSGGGVGELGLISIPSNIALAIGETKTITATCQDTYGNNMTCPTLTFSSPGGYITFDAVTYNSITIRGVNAGNTTLDVNSQGIYNYSNVTVTAAPTACSRLVKVQEGLGSIKVYKNNSLIATVTSSQTFTGLTGSDILKLEAVPASGYTFQKWCDENNSCLTGNPWQLGVECSFSYREYKAYFLQQITSVNITVTRKSGNGKVNVYQNNGFIGFLSDTETSRTFSFTTGSTFKFESTPNSGYIFEKYCQAGGINCITTDPFSGTVTSTGTVEVYFKQSGGATNYNCVSGQCQGPFATGQYGSLAACQTACTITQKWKCTSPGTCVQASDGTFNTQADCLASAGCQLAKYKCQIINGVNTCIRDDTNGTFINDPTCGGQCTSGGEIDPCASCNKDTQYCLFGSCYKKNDVYMAAGAVVLLMILTKK